MRRAQSPWRLAVTPRRALGGWPQKLIAAYSTLDYESLSGEQLRYVTGPRELIAQADMHLLRVGKDALRSPEQLRIFLFSDVILLATPHNGKFRVDRPPIPIGDAMVARVQTRVPSQRRRARELQLPAPITGSTAASAAAAGRLDGGAAASRAT